MSQTFCLSRPGIMAVTASRSTRFGGKPEPRIQGLSFMVSERICHMPLDQEEIAAGESDIAMSECRRTQYGLAGNLVTIISQFDTEGPCQSR